MKEINKIYKHLYRLPIEEVTRRSSGKTTTTYLRLRAAEKDNLALSSPAKKDTYAKFIRATLGVRGKKGIDEEYGLPHGAVAVMKEMTGYRSDAPKNKRIPKWIEVLQELNGPERSLLGTIAKARAETQYQNYQEIIEDILAGKSMQKKVMRTSVIIRQIGR